MSAVPARALVVRAPAQPRRAHAARSLRSSPAQRAPLRSLHLRAALGGKNEEDGPKITRTKEPDEYWKSEIEAAGKSPLQDPMAIAALLGLVVPFTILVIGIGSGYIEMH